MKQNFISELQARGMIKDMVQGAQSELEKGMTLGYIGFDPTADSLHVGHLVQIMTLYHFQQAGHKPIILVGGATGMVGDPSGKSAERNLLSSDTIKNNVAKIAHQLEHFLSTEGENAVVFVNNYDWMKDFQFLDFIRDVGKHITINYMMAKESVERRLETGLSFTEFSYQLIQGYDFYWLWKNKNVTFQLGGSDQWGNILTGIELIRKKGNGVAFGITSPLLKKKDGNKIGKSEGGNIWLDAQKTSPYKFYQYWINFSDEDIVPLIKIFSRKPIEELNELIAQHETQPHLRLLQKTLAKEITENIHSESETQKVIQASEILFGKMTFDELALIDKKLILQVFEDVPSIHISESAFINCPQYVDFLSVATQGTIFSSKGEARRMIQNGGVRINMEKITNGNDPLAISLIHQEYVIIQKGKKNYFLVSVSDA